MKNFFIILFLLFTGITVSAADKPKEKEDVWASPKHNKYSRTERWESLQAGFWFGVPPATEYEDVYGLKVGLPVCSGSGNVIGVEASFFCSATDHVKGLQCSIGNTLCEDFSGLQLSMVNIAQAAAYGTQAGLVNVAHKKGIQVGLVNVSRKAAFQIGLVNFNEGGWLPFMVFFNYTP
ncbi:MAG: hypothetical protein WCV67_09785 [Victivallaceae bacterium]|jgi:hypothetical protein